MDSQREQAELRTVKHLIVISYDAFSEENWQRASQYPNLRQLIKNGAYSTKLRSVYPTLTYVVHTTMVTGVYPDRHGIIHNNHFEPFVQEKDLSWYWFHREIKTPTIYDAVDDAHLTAAGILWPVTGKAAIKYNLPEIVAIKQENQTLKILKNGSPFYCLEMEWKYGRLRKGIEQPQLDDFSTFCAVDTIRNKKPNLLLLHLVDLDDTKHKQGTDSMEIDQVLARMDARLGKIIQAVDEAGIREETVFLILGDHGQFNVRYVVRLNKLLERAGLISQADGKMSWRAYCQSTGGAAYLRVQPGDAEAERLAAVILQNAWKEDRCGIEHIYSRKELDRLHVDQSIPVMVEAKTGYCFDDSLEEPIIMDLTEQNIKYATHGYSPDKANYHCNLLLSGSIVKKDYCFGDVEMVDIAPTMARILGIELTNCDGRVIEEIFKSCTRPKEE
ncbi:MAG TPA: ectonucleotide pyrophosphatase/phosphodiesterase [Bacillota bacterium]|nr:ectonucleotide pyrophosphatase/phosphodiesterase [Bacillota bacterium]